ncbi:MAG: helicase-exonuclease AddAB subunit AddA, partial [Clostridiales Family XIII bacterium]|nr:helicase-exonuclease AddAB subunit AddA [Clostridiales Family XIII bacterium]
MPEWTPQQLEAITARGRNLLVSAAAGSGKTAVLVERIRRIVAEEGIPLSSILVVTFTEAAASEMRQRLSSAIEDALEQAADVSGDHLDASVADFLRTQLQEVGSANISTFHAFALTILKRYYYTIEGLEPSFRVLDAFRAEILADEAMDALFEECFASRDDAFTDFLSRYATARSERSVRRMVADTYAFIRNQPDPAGWLEAHAARMPDGADALRVTDSFTHIGAFIQTALADVVFGIERLGTLLEEQGCGGLSEKNAVDLACLRAASDAFAGGVGWDEAGALLRFGFQVFRAKADEKEAYAEVKDIVKRRRDAVKKKRDRLLARYFARPLADMLADVAATVPHARALARLVTRYGELFSGRKRSEGMIDFGDIEHFAIEILRDEDVCAEYREKFAYIFIDEYQDSNYIQDTLIGCIKRPDNVFMVGDVKQSIYSFRNAEPAIFIEKYRSFPAREDSAVIDLNQNFRSKGGVIGSVNAVFRHLMSARHSAIAYDENAALKQGVRCGPRWEPRTELILVDTLAGSAPDAEGTPDAEEPDDEILAMKDAEREALAAAGLIRELRQTQIFDTRVGEERPVRNSDIVVLLREVQTSGAIFADTLNAEGISAYADAGDGYLDAVEIETFVNLLRVIDNPRRDVALAGTLYSQVFGFGMDELVRVRAARPEGFFCQSFLSYAEDGADPALRERCAGVLRRLAGWRRDENFMELSDFLWTLMLDSGYYHYVGALPGGAQRQANLRALVTRADAFQTRHVRRLFSFLQYVEHIRDKRIPVPPAKLLTEKDDVVRVLSVHKSKGLEFPIVLIGGLGKGFRRVADLPRLDLHKDAGVALTLEAPERHVYRKTLLQQIAAERRAEDEAAERLRLLYVAMTRAMDRLILLGSMKKAEEKLAVARQLDPEVDTDPAHAGSFLEMLLPLLADAEDAPIDVRVLPASALRRTRVAGVRDASRLAERLVAFAEDSADAAGADPGPEVAGFDAELARRLAWRYPYEDDLATKSKYSVSELNRAAAAAAPAAETAEVAAATPPPAAETAKVAAATPPPATETAQVAAATPSAPAATSAVRVYLEGSAAEDDEDAGTALTAAERGTALHKVFERLDYTDALEHRADGAWFSRWLDDLAAQGFLTEAERASVHPRTFLRYAGTPLFERAAKSAAAGRLRREAPFNYRMGQEGRDIIVQGVIDFFF